MSKKLEKLQEKRGQLEARIRAELAKQKKRDRARDTRKKILLGSYLMQRMEQDESDKERVMNDMDGFLIRAQDRAIFDLAAKEPEAASGGE